MNCSPEPSSPVLLCLAVGPLGVADLKYLHLHSQKKPPPREEQVEALLGENPATLKVHWRAQSRGTGIWLWLLCQEEVESSL